MLGELDSLLHGNRMLVSPLTSNQYGISMLLRIRYCFTWIPHVPCFLNVFIVFAWDTHINGHKKKPSHMGKPCELRNATTFTWGFHVGKACCKIMQN